MIICTNCHNELSDTAKFCPECGTRAPAPISVSLRAALRTRYAETCASGTCLASLIADEVEAACAANEAEIAQLKAQHPDVAAIQAEARRKTLREVENRMYEIHDKAWSPEMGKLRAWIWEQRDACQPTPSKTCSACGGTKIVEFRTNVGARYNVDCNACVTQPTPSRQEAPPTLDVDGIAGAVNDIDGRWMGESRMDWCRRIARAAVDFITHGADR